MSTQKIFFVSILMMLFTISCKKLVEVGLPANEFSGDVVFQSDVTAASAISGMYSELYGYDGFVNGSISSMQQMAGRSADEYKDHGSTGGGGSLSGEVSQNNIQVTNRNIWDLWVGPYASIYRANIIMEGLAKNSDKLSPTLVKQWTAEAKFIRAFCYFYLTNMFGDVPIALTTDYLVNNELHRQPAADVYAQITKDLEDAAADLDDTYSYSSNERVRPNSAAATALLARVYLYLGEWAKAESYATAVIDNPLYHLEMNMDRVFLNVSQEAIWQLMPVAPGQNTSEASSLILTATPGNVSLTDTLIHTFETGDQRKVNWVGAFTNDAGTFYYPYKYKIREQNVPVTEYSMVLRLGEQYLIRAEARAKLGKLTGNNSAQSDLNIIRERAGLGDTPASDEPALLLAIERERFVELFSEYGHRWFDLKRTDRADAILSVIKGAFWQPTDALYPVPFSEIVANSNLTQNPGYSQ